MANKAKTQTEQVGGNLNQLAANLSTKGEPTTAGLSIKKGFGQFIQNYKTKAEQLYNNLDYKVGPNKEVLPTNTEEMLNKFNSSGYTTRS